MYKKILLIVLVFALSLSFYGCKAIDVMKGLVSEEESEVEIVRSDEEDIEISNDVNMRDTVLYFQNENGYLVPVKREIPWETGIAKAALSNMIADPVVTEDIAQIGLMPIIPAGTEIIGMSINDGLCKVNFTNDILNYQSKKEEENIVKGIVYTLTEFPTIDKVQFMFEGQIINELEYGTKVAQPIERKDINLLDIGANGDSRIVVYYKGTSNGEYEYYVPVTLPISGDNVNVSKALRELFNGPPELTGLYTDIPLGVELSDVSVREGVAYIDINLESNEAISSQVQFDMMSKNIGLTLQQFNDIAGYEILIEGKTLEEAGLEFFEPEGLPVFANEY
ncbi:GerMN domain-containing protein [Caldisalinibacter kiritimatiensis]|uniref:Germination protein GerM n=1 Tax=Caldisalinibacter kiritimatiensis TaxID=1304284 RepID=R1CP57_9FIRM|nr:GerMN domain-containing protein [Caldisalinibacter kiritimatiensis]EOD00471.1 germination protein GerM [Caldisalinibacter kiritimatiensis]